MIGIFIDSHVDDFLKNLDKTYLVFTSEETFIDNLHLVDHQTINVLYSNNIQQCISSIIKDIVFDENNINKTEEIFIYSGKETNGLLIDKTNITQKNKIIINDSLGINDSFCLFKSDIFNQNLSMINDLNWLYPNLSLYIFAQLYHIEIDIQHLADSYLPIQNYVDLDFLSKLRDLASKFNIDISRFLKFETHVSTSPNSLTNDIKTILYNKRNQRFHPISKDNILLITLCYNEIRCLPFAIDYWRRLTNHVIVYDNGSTDGTLDFLKEHNDLIELKHFEYKDGNKINDDELRNFKNNIWKEYKDRYDWILICDVDEFPYVGDTDNFYNKINDNRWTVVKFHGIQLVSVRFPKYVSRAALAHHQIKYGANDHRFDKCLLFNCQEIEEINYDYGAHVCHPTGIVNWCNIPDARLFHFKFITEEYVVTRYEQSKNKLSEFNIKNNLGKEYMNSRDKIHDQFMSLVDHCRFVDDAFQPNTDNEIYPRIDHKEVYPILGNRCCIVIPIYKERMTDEELISFNSISRNCEGKYDICIIGNGYLNDEWWLSFCKKHNIRTVVLPDKWFSSIYSYNYLCLTADFYKIFSNYKYMMIFQLDGYMFYNDLEKFISLDYDYYGALHYSPYLKCGNGGVSLRKISSFISVLCSGVDIDYSIYEDVFFSNCGMLRQSPYEVCRSFCICDEKEQLMGELAQLPMCCHYLFWDHFWDKYLIEDKRT